MAVKVWTGDSEEGAEERTWPKALAAVALLAAAALGFFLYRAKREMRDLRTRTKALQEKLDQAKSREAEESGANVEVLLKDSDAAVRLKALEIVGRRDPERLRQLLPSFLESERESASLLAALNLAGKQEVVAASLAILSLLESGNPAVRRKAAAVLGEMAEALSAGERERAGEAIAAAVERERAALGQAGRGSETGIFLPYIGALGKMKEFARAAPVLLKFLRSARHPMLRRSCALALQGVAEKAHEKALKAAWRTESDPMVRLAVEQVLTRAPFNLKVDRKRNVLLPKGP